MRIGALLPHEAPGFGADIGAIAELTQAAEALGYDHIRMGEQVLGANPSGRTEWKGTYNYQHPFHDPFVLFAYLVALTRTLEFATCILILPQRQTAVVAKQAATLDLISGGRLRLGIGVGWNPVEFEALGHDFSTRGRRCEEQVELMRFLWTRELVTYRGHWDTIIDAGLNPLPIQRPIPIWIGGRPGSIWIGSGCRYDESGSAAKHDRVMRPIARMADGFLHDFIRREGRDISEVGIEGSISLADSLPEDLACQASAWKELGVTHLSANTAATGFTSVGEHIDALE